MDKKMMKEITVRVPGTLIDYEVRRSNETGFVVLVLTTEGLFRVHFTPERWTRGYGWADRPQLVGPVWKVEEI